MGLAQAGNVYFDRKAPWVLKKSDLAACGTAIHVCLRMVQALAVVSAPFTPSAARRLFGYLGAGPGPTRWAEAAAELPAGRALNEPAVLFAKLDLEAITADSPGGS
jgi:methionyl-tRNA synthetase